MFLDLDHDVGFVVQAERRAHLVHVGPIDLGWQFTVGSDQSVRWADLADIVRRDVRVTFFVDGSGRIRDG